MCHKISKTAISIILTSLYCQGKPLILNHKIEFLTLIFVFNAFRFLAHIFGKDYLLILTINGRSNATTLIKVPIVKDAVLS